jgi:hypothetical protein
VRFDNALDRAAGVELLCCCHGAGWELSARSLRDEGIV